ncbi:MAG: GntR family transcriptional regulator [Chloroflexi bacterium OLB15]|nr:MAG: GntR family transcriptional regulator [Chloroflexi bacterium OLB15]
MIDAKSSKPLYEQIKEYLLTGIQNGVFQPGDRIPSERDLSEQFKVSRLTVNKAVKELERIGVVYAQVGKGTFISSVIYQQQLNFLTGFTDEMRSRGYSSSSRVLSAQMVAAPDDIALILNVMPGARLIQLRRVRLADDQPVAIETANLVSTRFPDLLEGHDFSSESLYQVLREEYGIILTYAEQSIEARMPTREELTVLGLKPTNPVLSMTRVVFTEDKRPIEYVQSVYRGDRYKFRVVLRNV